jgi:hypothetical protein
VRFIDESDLFKDLFDSLEEPLTGTLNLYVDDGRGICVVGLLLNRLTNGLIAVPPSNKAYPSNLN